ncbi:homocysteine S-methyltransferase family protein [Pseudoramibacter sp.]|jgi:5-methyltetrahydrofolate--homocysteine methyltransferase|uniref:homocysteine S-methyltransferase family protein n=1 Tax=Pseudoramibacter sp. TaxID=2034862 RepID=UPI0025D694BF|nr:homocysteine S-methyltransferase family protein [Pseudoramibacter sp.]MCH4071346.1 homocysteine S-methyltransferase family protein [Pseudoramibacter sp.]MCH4105114.1 homocysteine S-methyltransferase family protein [Pseudoramibacter sp.]
MEFREAIKKQRLYLDGAMGSMIQKRIENPGPVPEELNITHPDVIGEIQSAYVQAGADILIANTFGANDRKMAASKYSVEEVIRQAVKIAKAQHPKYVAMDIGPSGALIGDIGDFTFEEAAACFERSARAGAEAGADLILIETMTDIVEARAAVIGARRACDLPIVASMTYESNGRTLTGSDPETVVTILENLKVDAIGINCSTGPEEMLPVVKTLIDTASVPIMVEPNAGLPRDVDGQTVYDVSAEDFSDIMAQIAEAGAAILGGCCGTTPDYIAKLVEKTKDLPHKTPWTRPQPMRIASTTRTVTLGTDVRTIGEAINPTASAALKEDLRKGGLTVAKQLAMEQKRQGADILDVNVGLPELDEKETMLRVVKAISQVVDLPLQIDSTKPEVIEAVLQTYPGKVLINSVNGEAESRDAILPLVARYGAGVLGLALDENGLPKTAEDRLKVADKIIAHAKSLGISQNNVAIDCLVLTASAQQKACGETLLALTLVKEKYGVPTVLGVSNISFGLPNRRLINKTFLTMALAAGLDTPILKVGDTEMMNAISAYRALSGIDEGCMDYVAAHKHDKQTAVPEKTAVQENQKNQDEEDHSASNQDQAEQADMKQMVVDGLKDEIVPAVEEALKTQDPMAIINGDLIPGLDVIGDLFETGEVFLPNLIFAAETVQNAFAVLKQHMSAETDVQKNKVILATVKGDVHDIGKNILKTIMENYGYQIIDLGKDVDPEIIVETAVKENVKLVGLSALMTTTVKNMETTIEMIKAADPDIKVMVGGAVMNEAYAKKIHADYYGKDAKAGVAIAEEVFGK